MNYLNNLHSIIIPETRNNEQAVEAGEIGQRGAGEDREGRPRDEADHIRDGRGNGEVAGERERARGEQRHSETRQEYVLDGVLHVPVHKGRRGVEDDPRSVHPSWVFRRGGEQIVQGCETIQLSGMYHIAEAT